jgi:hypothetical protein
MMKANMSEDSFAIWEDRMRKRKNAIESSRCIGCRTSYFPDGDGFAKHECDALVDIDLMSRAKAYRTCCGQSSELMAGVVRFHYSLEGKFIRPAFGVLSVGLRKYKDLYVPNELLRQLITGVEAYDVEYASNYFFSFLCAKYYVSADGADESLLRIVRKPIGCGHCAAGNRAEDIQRNIRGLCWGFMHFAFITDYVNLRTYIEGRLNSFRSQLDTVVQMEAVSDSDSLVEEAENVEYERSGSEFQDVSSSDSEATEPEDSNQNARVISVNRNNSWAAVWTNQEYARWGDEALDAAY